VPRTRKDADLRREEILRTTAELVRSNGVHAVRMADVAGALGVSSALVVYHFKTKEQLIGETFRWAAQEDLAKLDELMGQRSGALERLRVVIAWYAPTGAAKGWELWIHGWAAALTDPTLRQVGHELDLRWKEALTAVIRDGQRSGEFRVADPRAAAWRITALMDGLAVQSVVHRGLQNGEQSDAWVREFVERELGASI
jgi:AcrR family transcriptional regulator